MTTPTPAFLAQAMKMGLSEEEAGLFFRLATDRYGEGMPGLLRIRDKDQNLVPFRPTRAHKKLARNMRRRNYWVKPRQVWATSFRLAGGIEPGDIPPTSAWWARLATKPNNLPRLSRESRAAAEG